MTEKKLSFMRTCFVCPEQYDVFLGKKRVAYIRLRWGFLTAYLCNFDGTIGEAFYRKRFGKSKNKICYKGGFANEKERKEYLDIIEKKLLRRLDGK